MLFRSGRRGSCSHAGNSRQRGRKVEAYRAIAIIRDRVSA